MCREHALCKSRTQGHNPTISNSLSKENNPCRNHKLSPPHVPHSISPGHIVSRGGSRATSSHLLASPYFLLGASSHESSIAGSCACWTASPAGSMYDRNRSSRTVMCYSRTCTRPVYSRHGHDQLIDSPGAPRRQTYWVICWHSVATRSRPHVHFCHGRVR